MIDLIDLIEVPAGTFLMGSPKGESHYGDECPQHEVTFAQPFFLGKYPVTQAQWRAVAALPKVERDLKPNPSHFEGDNRPVEQVSWLDAMEFCARLSRDTGWLYRLPTEAEWEYACRAGTTTPFHFGKKPDTPLLNCLMPGGPRATTPVGTFPPNPWGLHDMHGNVWEWCLDKYSDSYEGAPADGSPRTWETEGDFVARGGSWSFFPERCRSAYRYWFAHGDSLDGVGFRVLRGGSWGYGPAYCRAANRYWLAPDVSNSFVGFRVACETGDSQTIATTQL